MVDCLDGLRHDRIVRSDDDDCYIRHFRTTCTHRREGRVTRGIQERNVLTVLQFDVICTDVLGDTSGLTGNHIRVTDVVQQGCLTVIHVTHHRDDRAARFHILVVHHLIGVDLIRHVRRDVLRLETELLGNQVDCLGVETLVDRHKQAKAHTSTDNLVHRHIHHHRQVVGRHELRQLQHFGLLLSLHHFEFMLLTLLFATLAFIFRGVGFVLFLLQTAQRLLQCLIHLFLRSLTRLVLLVFLTYLVAFVVRINLRRVRLEPFTFTLLRSSLLLGLLRLLTLFTLFAFLLFGLLRRTR